MQKRKSIAYTGRHLAKTKVKRRKPVRILSFFLILFLLPLSLAFVSPLSLSDDHSSELMSRQLETMGKYNFIKEIAALAKEQQEAHGLLSSLILAQASLESDFGRSSLASQYYNLFGVKAYGDVPKVTLETLEFTEDNQWITIQGDFRVYENWGASVAAHTALFVNGVDWDPSKYHSVLSAQDYKEGALALQQAGYATDPNYADKLIKMIESYQLYQYD